MEVSWYGEGASKEMAAMVIVVEALKELRRLGRIPEDASLAYIADIPWQEPAAEEDSRSAEHVPPLESLLQMGEDTAERVWRQNG